MNEERCPKCGYIAYPGDARCDECGAALSGRARLSPYEQQQSPAKRNVVPNRSIWQVLWPLSLLAIVVFPERALALLIIPGMAPLLAAAILVIGLPSAWRSRRPRISHLGVIGSALVPLCFWLRPAFLLPWIPSMLPLVLMVLVGFVLLDAGTFRDPESFCIGVIMIAVPLGSLWPLHAWIARLELGFRAYNIVLHGVALFFSMGMFMGGAWFLSDAFLSDRNKSRG
jgi:hypothetical protein